VSARRHTLIAAGIWLVLSVVGVAVVAGMQILPAIASREAEIENGAFVVLTAMSVPVLLLVVVPMAYSILRFRAEKGEALTDGPPIHDHPSFEAGWVVASLVAVLALSAYGAAGLLEIRGDRAGSVEVTAVASQWTWRFLYPGIEAESKELVLPVGESVHITIVSKDVIHSFSVPAFGVKQDAVPGRETFVDVTPTFTGHYGGQCAELCGFGHTRMVAEVRVVEAGEFSAWLDELREEPPE
jgi:cytochrome c oxidase subunit 2